MNGNKKPSNTFIVKILDQQNASWQGNITWVEENREQYFRSTLELLKMIDGALEKQNAVEEGKEGGSHEK
ncbi:MAG: hypothetical protein PHW34_11840 [Hespellia sp.]|nr:hypothetical protein [Hespellia sp.]